MSHRCLPSWPKIDGPGLFEHFSLPFSFLCDFLHPTLAPRGGGVGRQGGGEGGVGGRLVSSSTTPQPSCHPSHPSVGPTLPPPSLLLHLPVHTLQAKGNMKVAIIHGATPVTTFPFMVVWGIMNVLTNTNIIHFVFFFTSLHTLMYSYTHVLIHSCTHTHVLIHSYTQTYMSHMLIPTGSPGSCRQPQAGDCEAPRDCPALHHQDICHCDP